METGKQRAGGSDPPQRFFPPSPLDPIPITDPLAFDPHPRHSATMDFNSTEPTSDGTQLLAGLTTATASTASMNDEERRADELLRQAILELAICQGEQGQLEGAGSVDDSAQDDFFGGVGDVGIGLGLDAEFQDDDNDVRLDIAPAPPEIGGDQPLQGLMDDLNTVLDEKNKRTVCESFETDFSIHEAGNELGIAPADLLEQLGKDAERIRKQSLLKGRSRLTRDNFIADTDVANILRTMVNQKVQKHRLENFSAEAWMLNLKEKGYFTYFDEEMGTVPRSDGTFDKRGQYHGFASKWQMEQLLAFVSVICIDGAHKVYGIEKGWKKKGERTQQ
ncbi:hypothetical protein B0O80DRAFT_430093 [Mortierella sp. GBAus27b]|nr:hypothetical protein B0O80DRAFT_430093 [Mortierella sp. GBAus27b]